MHTLSIWITLLLAGAPVDARDPAQAPHGHELVRNGSLTEAGARLVLDQALAAARERRTTGAFAIVDSGGALLAFARLDGTFPAASRVAAGKALTAAQFRRPTQVFEELVNKGRTAMTALADFTPLAGGVPLVHEGVVVGAIGVSGAASAAEDVELAVAAAEAWQRPPAPLERAEVRHLGAAEVRAGFATGSVLVPPSGLGFQVHASRREAPGEAEVHASETDVIYVLSGTATLVTGGELVMPRPAAADEIRGRVITGGTPRRLAAGDVVVVPAGTAHWFQAVDSTFLYYVVKVELPPARAGS